VTSIGCGDSKGAISEKAYDVLKDALVAKEKVENQLQKFYKFTTDYTIIRPGGLSSDEATGKAELTVRGRARTVVWGGSQLGLRPQERPSSRRQLKVVAL